jgi:hypothetical protein
MPTPGECLAACDLETDDDKVRFDEYVKKLVKQTPVEKPESAT